MRTGTAAAAVAVVAALYYMAFEWPRVKFPVHTSGAVIVTGASTGIGFSTARFLAERSDFVVYAGVRSNKAADRITSQGLSNLKPVLLDVTSDESVQAAVQAVVDDGHPLVGLINNAGISIQRPVEMATLADFQRVMDVNLYGVLRMVQATGEQLRAHQGRIINIGSIVGLIASASAQPYGASKFALESVTHSLREDMQQFNVSVSMINPGAIKTDLGGKIETSFEQLPSETAHLEAVYGKLMTSVRALAAKAFRLGAEPEDVAIDVMHALTAPYPRTRYVNGNALEAPAWVATGIAWFFPQRLASLLGNPIALAENL